jgi:hypothetical protein
VKLIHRGVFCCQGNSDFQVRYVATPVYSFGSSKYHRYLTRKKTMNDGRTSQLLLTTKRKKYSSILLLDL